MDYISLLKTVIGHLERLGIECTAIAGGPVTDQELAAAEDVLKVGLPTELREFYQEVGDGLLIHWRSDPDDPKKPWGFIEVPELASLAAMRDGWRGLVLYTPEQAEKYGFPYTDDPALAKRTAARMWNWLPLMAEENGDSVCLDLGTPGCPVVFDRHDWVDGGTGENGHPLAPNWRAFLMNWGSVCFQQPDGLYWPWCFRPNGVAWDGEHFRDPFRVASLVESRDTMRLD